VTPPGAAPPGLGRAALVAAVRAALPDTPEPAVVALSGGPDSAGLLRLAAEAAGARGVVALHVRHGLRDDAGDAACARTQAAAVGAAFTELTVEVTPGRRGVAAAARRARLEALAGAAASAGAAHVLLAHTAEDRAETIVLNLARGAGLPGLAAMPAWREHGGVALAHPLRSVRRADVRAVAAHGPAPVADPTNADRRRRRTRARHDVLPALASLSGGDGDPVATLTRLGDLAAADAQALDELAAREGARLRRDWPPAVALDADGLAALPVALARRVVRAALADAAGAIPEAGTVEAARQLGRGQRRTLAGGVAVARQGRWLVARPETVAAVEPRVAPAPGAVALAPLALRLRVGAAGEAPAPPAGPPPLAGPPGAAPSPVLELTGPATVRARAPGDRVCLEGVARPVTRVLRRAGVPGLLRDLAPVVVEADGRLAGVVGVVAADAAPSAPWRAWAEPVAS